jgi:Flp pilus assembly protein TadG
VTVLGRRHARGGRHQARRGGALLFFLLVALPLVVFGSVLAVDVTRVVMTQRQMSNATEAAARAGAQQFQANSRHLDIGRSVTTARSALSRSETIRATSATIDHSRVTVQVTNNPYGSQRVTVHAPYQVDGLVFTPLLSLLLGQGVGVGHMELTATRLADVCVPGEYLPTAGSCTRP